MKRKTTLLIFFILIFFSCKKNNIEVLTNDSDLVKVEKTDVIIRTIPAEKLDQLEDSIQLYYNKLENFEIWYDLKNRSDLINEIKNSYKEGLNPNDYSISTIDSLEKKRNKLNDDEIINYDILLTNNYKKLATHLYKGKIDPKTVYSNWDLKKTDPSLSDTLMLSIKNKTVSKSFENLKPQDFMYKKIKYSLALLETFPKDSLQKITLKDKIQLNDTIEEIIKIKQRLHYWKDYFRTDSIITPIYDEYTFEAIKTFQERHGLKPDGVIGSGTIKALNYSKEERIEQAIVNLERWKWFPHDFGNEYLIVNLPDYKLKYIIEKDTVAEHTLVVGKKSRQTPILTSKISNLVFNPTWTVPPTIIKEDLTPAATRNLNYFTRNNMNIYDSTGQKVQPENWNPELSKTYRYVQAPSYNNSLGVLKFNFPNRHSVYLHDTNHRDYFTRDYKALSSGCVRVEKPTDLADKILAHEKDNWNKSTIDTLLKRKNTKIIPIKHDINVLFLYWTNWSNGNQLIFRDDIYSLDKKLYNALRN